MFFFFLRRFSFHIKVMSTGLSNHEGGKRIKIRKQSITFEHKQLCGSEAQAVPFHFNLKVLNLCLIA